MATGSSRWDNCLRTTECLPGGDILKSFTSAEHFLPLLSLSGGDQGRENVASNQDSGSRVIEALKKIETWKKSQAEQPITPRLVRSAVSVTNPPPAPEGEEDDVVADVRDHIGKAATDILKYIEKVRGALPEPKQKKTIAALKKMENKVAALGSRSRSTKISWTEATWNPLQGCTRASRGCDNCYAAKVIAVRKKHQYPGLAVAKTAKGVTTYSFTGKILLLQHALSEPLDDRIGKLFFVNSMSDLFHKDVPDDFIDEVFDVMERASWHVFQVLTKRPKHMADYTVRRYAEKTPPPNIWLGASTEDQEAFDTRYRDLLRVKTAVRWLSCEPLLGPLKMILKGIDWVVVGGESGKTDRKMAKSWATALRDQCKKGDIPFFFKQWGAFGEDGERVPYVRAKAKPKAKLDGVVHEYYPPQLKTVITNF